MMRRTERSRRNTAAAVGALPVRVFPTSPPRQPRRINMVKHIILTVGIALASGAADRLRADDRYYLLMFGSQSEPKAVRLSHSFAVFVKASTRGASAPPDRIETCCISWMPKT